MTSRTDEPIPPSQLFRTLLLHFLETHKILSPVVQHTTSKELKFCHMQNAYILSEIGSYLADLSETSDLTPSLSAAHAAELLGGVVSSLHSKAAPTPASGPTPNSAPTVRTDLPPGIRRAASSRRRVSTPPPVERTSTGQIIFRQQFSSAKPPSTSPTPTSDTPESGNNPI
jgi:hypothetical protein